MANQPRWEQGFRLFVIFPVWYRVMSSGVVGRESVVGWLLNVVYLVLLLAGSPVLLWRMVAQGKYHHGWREKLLGLLPRSDAGERVIWLHAVSVGEVLQLRIIVLRLLAERPGHTILITTTTHTGHALARETFPDCRVAYLPLDFTWAVKRAIWRVRPVLVGLVELELWPNLIRQTSLAGIPLMLINGRISERSHRGYRRVRFLMRPLLNCFQALAVQTDVYASRLEDLGAPPQRVTVTGSVKFDGVQITTNSEQTAALKSAFGIHDAEIVLIAGSTHDPEEAIVLDAWQELRQEFPQLRLILVPRHQERFESVATLIESRGLSLIRRSQCPPASRLPPHASRNSHPVCLLDTLGELSACWGLADVAFVGGSLTRRGGQNMIEPAACGIPVIVGPNTSNFRDVVEGLDQVGGIRTINQPTDFIRAVHLLLTDPLSAARQGVAARQFVVKQQGATEQTMEILLRQIPQSVPQTSEQVA